MKIGDESHVFLGSAEPFFLQGFMTETKTFFPFHQRLSIPCHPLSTGIE
jgi:hypothetical protein